MNEESVKLLNECSAGIEMGVSAIDDVKGKVESAELEKLLERCRGSHVSLGDEVQSMLGEYGIDPKDAPVMAKAMSHMKTGMRLATKAPDAAASELIAEGCDMGVRSLSGYLNAYTRAEPRPRDIANRLIALEAQMSVDMRKFM